VTPSIIPEQNNEYSNTSYNKSTRVDKLDGWKQEDLLENDEIASVEKYKIQED